MIRVAAASTRANVPRPLELLLQRKDMRVLLVLWLGATLLGAADAEWSVTFDDAGLRGWHLPIPEKWHIVDEGGNKILQLREPGPIGNPRRPQQFALWQPGCVSDFELDVKVRRNGRSLLIAFGFQDRLHFYYTHISGDSGDFAVHNGLFKVDGGERFRIAGSGSAPALPTTGWHRVRVVRNVTMGSIDVFIDGGQEPRFHVIDRSFTHGWTGIGSFDETGDFDDFRLRGAPSAECRQEWISPLDRE